MRPGRHGSVVTLICDGGERYADTYYSDDWVAAQGLDLAPHLATIDRFLATPWPPDGVTLDVPAPRGLRYPAAAAQI